MRRCCRGVRPAPVRRSPRSSDDRCVCSHAKCVYGSTHQRPFDDVQRTVMKASGAGVPPSMFGGRSVVVSSRAKIREGRVQRDVRAEHRLRRVLDPPDPGFVEVRAHQHRTVDSGDEHGAVGVLRGDGLAADHRADGARRQNQRLLLDVGVHVVDEEREVRAPEAVPIADAGLVLAGSSRVRAARRRARSRPPRRRPSCRRSRRARRRPARRPRIPTRSGPACRGRSCAAPGSRG